MIRSGNNVVKLFLSMLALSMPLALQAADDLAKQAQNPIANLISLPLQNNTNFNVGRDKRKQNILNVQPVWPVTLNEDWNLITRTIVPVMSQPLANGDRENGLGDTTFTGFFSPIDPGDFTWGVGKIFRVGKQPMNGQVAAYYNAEKPEFGADWQLRVQLQFLFPK